MTNTFIDDCEIKVITKKGYYINIRNTATNILINEFLVSDIKKYKKGNYMLEIIKLT